MNVLTRPPGAEDKMVTMDDDALWEALRWGDEEAFRTIFERHSRTVYNVAFRYAASWSVAEEATQACFTAVWQRACAGRLTSVRRGAVRAWLCAFGRNEARNLARGATRRLRLIGRMQQQPGREARDNVEQWVGDEESMRRINEVLSKIPDGQRQVVELVAWGGCSMAETADALGVPVGTVKSRLARARATLSTTEVAHLLGKEN